MNYFVSKLYDQSKPDRSKCIFATSKKRRLFSIYYGPILRLRTEGTCSEVDVYAVAYPSSPPKKKRLRKKWRKRYATLSIDKELYRIINGGKIKNI